MPTDKGEDMRRFNAQFARVTMGSGVTALKELLGEPMWVVARADTVTPSETFRQVGLNLTFGDADVEEVWVYVDPHRPRLRHCVGLSKGAVAARWKEMLSVERYRELYPVAGGG
jgi:hypothetical protein